MPNCKKYSISEAYLPTNLKDDAFSLSYDDDDDDDGDGDGDDDGDDDGDAVQLIDDASLLLRTLQS